MSRVPYHGGSLNRNSCKRLLDHIDELQALCPLCVLPFVKAFRGFHNVVKSCFSVDLHGKFEDDILTFKESYLDLQFQLLLKYMLFSFMRRNSVVAGVLVLVFYFLNKLQNLYTISLKKY